MLSAKQFSLFKYKLLEYTRGNIEFPAGEFCQFVYLSDEIGIKVYRFQNLRDAAYISQKKSYKLGFAPNVGESFDITLDFKVRGQNILYCYVTEVANWIKKDDEIFKKEMKELIRTIETHGFVFSDPFRCNVGYIKDKLVVIDFDPVSFGIKDASLEDRLCLPPQQQPFTC